MSNSLDPDLVRAIEDALPNALGGDRRAARRYARSWHALVLRVLGSGTDVPTTVVDVLDRLSLTAPFDPLGPLHTLVSVAGAIIDDVDGSTAVSAMGIALPTSMDFDAFSGAVLEELSDVGAELRSLLEAWRLSIVETARLFGVTRQAVQQWLEDGVPTARQPKVLTVLRIADLLSMNLKADRIPGIVRSPAAGYDGSTMLELIANDHHQELLDSVARSFDWAAAA